MLLARVGATIGFGCVYAIHIELFPSNVMTNSFGICNFFARGLTMLAPFFAEMEDKSIPFTIMALISLVAMVSSIFLKKKSEKVFLR